MPISSFLAPSAIALPGVCTSSTRPASPYQGQVIYQTDTNTTLVWNGSGWVLLSTGTANPPGLELITPTSVTGGTLSSTGAVTITSGTSTTVMSGVFSAQYDNYRFVIANGQASQNLSLCFYLGTNASSGLYYGTIYYDQYTGSSTGNGRRNGGNNMFLGLTDSAGANLGTSFDLNSPFLTKQKTVHGTYDGRNYAGWFGGLVADSSSHTGITFLNEAGTLTAGVIRVYGYRN